MRVLVLGLYAEGSTDHDFLPPVIQKTAERILAQHEQCEVEALVFPIEPSKSVKKDHAKGILQAARDSFGYHALIVHADADDPTPEKALSERILPGYRLVQHAKGQVCKHLVPIIPVQAIEAWVLADYELLLAEIRNRHQCS